MVSRLEGRDAISFVVNKSESADIIRTVKAIKKLILKEGGKGKIAGFVQVRGGEEAVRISDDYTPEHLELHVRDADYYFSRLKNYGSLFIGEETTVAYGDKAIGTNHILPTSRSARYTAAVRVKRYSKIQYT